MMGLRLSVRDKSLRRRRVIWSLADQVVSSMTNFALTVSVARSVSPRTFGAFALVYGAFVLSIGITRALTSEVISIQYSQTEPRAFVRSVRPALGLSISLGIVTGLVIAVGGDTIGASGSVLRGLLVICAAMPLLVLQDTLRFCFVAMGRPRSAFFNDLAWAVVQFSLLAVLIIMHSDRFTMVLGAWALGGVAASVLGLAQMKCSPSPRDALRWLREHRDLAVPCVLEFFAGQGAYQFSVFIVAALAGLTASAAVRGVQTVFGPLVVISAGVTMAAVPELSRIAHRSRTEFLRGASLAGLSVGTAAVATGVFLLVLPARVGTALLGASWPIARPLIPFLLVQKAAEGLSVGAFSGLRALRKAKQTATLRTATGLATIGAAVVGAGVDGARGFMISMSIVAPIATALWWARLLRGTESRPGFVGGMRAGAHRISLGSSHPILRTTTLLVPLGVGAGLANGYRPLLLFGAVVAAAIVIIAWSSAPNGLARITIWLTSIGLIASTWNAVRVHSFTLSDVFFLAALVILPLSRSFGGTPLQMPRALKLGAGIVAFGSLLGLVFPPSTAYMAERVTSASLAQGFGVAAGSFSSGVGALIKFEFAIFAVPALIAFVLRDARLVRVGAYLWAASSVLDALVAVGHHYGLLSTAQIVSGVEGTNRESGLTVQPNHLGLTCALALPIVLYAFSTGGKARLLAIPSVGILSTAIILSQSRGAVAAAAIGVVLTSFALPGLKRPIFRLVPIVAAVVVLSFSRISTWAQLLAAHVRLSGGNVSSSDAARSSLTHQATVDITSHPILGVGLSQVTQAHDIYLGLLAGGGPLLFIGFLLVVGSSLVGIRGAPTGVAPHLAVGSPGTELEFAL